MTHAAPNVEPVGGAAPGAPPRDPRVARTRALALEAAQALFREGGWDAVTHVAVSQRSGIGRTTLYRHWPEASSLLRELFACRVEAERRTATGDLRGDLLNALEQLRRSLLDPSTERAMLTVMERAAVDPAYAELRVAITRDCALPVTAIVRAASADGRLRHPVDPEAALAQLAGPLVFRRFFLRDDLPGEALDQVVDDFLAAHATERLRAEGPRAARPAAGGSGGRGTRGGRGPGGPASSHAPGRPPTTVRAMELWHNPRCSKSRAAKAILDEAGAEYTERRYLEDPPDAATLDAVLVALGKQPWEVTRMGEGIAKELGLAARPHDREEWIALLVAHPVLIERPILVADDGRAVLGRPPEEIAALL